MLRTRVDLVSNTDNQERDEDEVIEVVMNIHEQPEHLTAGLLQQAQF